MWRMDKGTRDRMGAAHRRVFPALEVTDECAHQAVGRHSAEQMTYINRPRCALRQPPLQCTHITSHPLSPAIPRVPERLWDRVSRCSEGTRPLEPSLSLSAQGNCHPPRQQPCQGLRYIWPTEQWPFLMWWQAGVRSSKRWSFMNIFHKNRPCKLQVTMVHFQGFFQSGIYLRGEGSQCLPYPLSFL